MTTHTTAETEDLPVPLFQDASWDRTSHRSVGHREGLVLASNNLDGKPLLSRGRTSVKGLYGREDRLSWLFHPGVREQSGLAGARGSYSDDTNPACPPKTER